VEEFTMNKEVPKAPDLDSSAKPQPQRKPYRKPEFFHELVFESTALACGKINATEMSCRYSRRTS
jgi:hypothetical protein